MNRTLPPRGATWALCLALVSLLAPGFALAQDLSCGDTFTDTGGADGDYDVSEDYTVTICPEAGTTDAVTVTFTAFDMEDGFDFLVVLDGEDADGAFLDAATGQEIPGPYSSVAGGCLTFRAISDGSVTGAGWVANVTCGPSAVTCYAPLVDEDPFFVRTTTTLELPFERRGDAVATEGEIGAPGFAPGTGAAIQSVVNDDLDSLSIVFDGLTVDTEYEVYLRSSCGTDAGVSEWVGPFTARTRVEAPAYSECTEALALTVTDPETECVATSLTTFGATASGAPSGFPDFDDVFVTFVATTPTIDVTVDPADDSGLDFILFEVLSACDGEVLGSDFVDADGVPAVSSVELEVGETYVARVITADADNFIIEAALGLCLGSIPPPPPLTCGDLFTDTGGVGEDYGVSENYTVTICPEAESTDAVTVTFTAFDLEDGFDILAVFDGKDDSGALLDIATGQEIPGPYSSVAGGCLTFRAISDGSVTAAGWVADVTCGPSAVTCYDPLVDEDPFFARTTTTLAIPFERRGDAVSIEGEIGAPGFTPGSGEAIQAVVNTDPDSTLITFTDLTLDTEYEVYLRSNCGPNSGVSDWVGPFTSRTRVTPPDYDECDDAVELTVADPDGDCVATSLTSFGATASDAPSAFNPLDDIFVTFVATTPNFTIEVNPLDDTGLDFILFEVLDACDGTEIDYDFVDADGVPLRSEVTLEVGETYVARIVTADADALVTESAFDLCLQGITPPPAALTCGDLFTDSGGAEEDYLDDEDYTVNICPAEDSGEFVTVSFKEFALEEGFDVLLVYNGLDTAGALLDVATGTRVPGPYTSSASDGCLTFRFVSDVSVTQPGWEAEVTCGPAIPCRVPFSAGVVLPLSTSLEVGFGRYEDTGIVIGEIGEPGFVPGTSAELQSVSNADADSLSMVFTDLEPNTAYEFYVRADCGDGAQSEWVGPFSARTRLPPPNNDACGAAATLTLSSEGGDCEVAALTSVGATVSGEDSDYIPFDDIFVTFVATTERFTAELVAPEGSDLDFILFELIDGCGGDAIDDVFIAADGVPTRVDLVLEVGETYTARIVTADADGNIVETPFDLCLREVPPPPSALSCGEVFTDNAGAAFDYENSQDYTVTVCPAEGSEEAVTVTFSVFNLETNFDFLEVYNGLDTAGNLIEAATGAELPGPYTSTAEDGCLSFRFISDGSLTREGWEAIVSCAPVSSIGRLPEGAAFEVYPNPAQREGSFTVVLPAAIADAEAALTLRDVTGRPVYERRDLHGEQTLTLTPGGLSAGVYFLSLDAAGARSTQRLIVE